MAKIDCYSLLLVSCSSFSSLNDSVVRKWRRRRGLGCFEKIDIVGVYVGCEQSVGRAILVGSPTVFTASNRDYYE